MSQKNPYEYLTEGAGNIFGVLGTVSDGALSILNDWSDYFDLNKEVERQSQGFADASSWGAPAQTSTSNPLGAQGASDDTAKWLIFGGVGLGALALGSLLFNK